MIVGYPHRILYTFVVLQESPPARGQVYVDPRGRHWTVRGVTREFAVLRDPPGTAWHVEMESDHPAYRIEQGEDLRRFFRSSEIASRREMLTTILRDVPNFEVVGVSEDGFTLIANFTGALVNVRRVPCEVDGMPVVVKFVGDDRLHSVLAGPEG